MRESEKPVQYEYEFLADDLTCFDHPEGEKSVRLEAVSALGGTGGVAVLFRRRKGTKTWYLFSVKGCKLDPSLKG